jgi:outer membrane protein assembly factor BamB
MDRTGKVTAAFAAAAVAIGFGVEAQAQDAVAYQINVAHSGSTSIKGFRGRLTQIWSKDFGGQVSYPLIAEGMVFVTVAGGKGGAYGTELYALDAATGNLVWKQAINGTYFWSNAAYENGKIFVVNFNGLVRAFSAQTGVKTWQSQMPGQYAFSSPPTAVNGTLYVGGAGSGGTLYAVDETDGHVKWRKGVSNGDHSSPAYGDSGIYVTYPCQYSKFAPETGDLLWHVSTGCEGGGGRTPVYAFGQVYVRDTASPSVVLSSDSGKKLDKFAAQPAPAFFSRNGARYGVALSSGVLICFDFNTKAKLWNFKGDGELSTAPIVVGSWVIEGSRSGELYVLDGLNGDVRWSGNVGQAIFGPDEQNVSQPLTGLGAGGGLVVVPAASTLVAYATR